MAISMPYRREDAVDYAEAWALRRNPKYYDYENLGGDCTNFVSQCLYAGSGVMNYTPTFGWYYIDANRKSPSWTGVVYLYNFLTENISRGVYGRPTSKENAMPGDVIQLGNQNRWYHSLLLLSREGNELYVAAHDNDALYRPLSSYRYDRVRFIHILGYYTD
ncbi:MAG: amidase domain-containing protein [Clostridia bacterium]|nr:amidase domain-containing protein [Clostridia bacterium]